jgi:hypothetical protein
VAQQRGAQPGEGLDHPASRAVGEGGLTAGQLAQHAGIAPDDVVDGPRIEGMEREALDVDLPAGLGPARAFPMGMDVELDLVPGARERPHLPADRVVLRAQERRAVHLVAQPQDEPGVDEEREARAMAAGDLEQRPGRFDQAALDRAGAAAEIHLVIQREQCLHPTTIPPIRG